MRTALIVLACAVAAGCATGPSPAESAAIARNSPEWELCYVAVSGRGTQALRSAVYSEMSSRRTDCNQHAGLVQARLQADAAKRQQESAAGLQMLQMARPQQPAAASTGANCRSFWRGTYWQTVCD